MRTDVYAELYLRNKNVDSLIRVLQRLESFHILPGQTLKECEIRLEELQSVLNVRILEAMLPREQDAEACLQQLVPARHESGTKNNLHRCQSCVCAVGMLRKHSP